PSLTDDRPGFAPTYFPGTTIARDAQSVHVDLGRDGLNVVIPLIPAPTVTVSGRVIDTSGQPLKLGLNLLQTYADDVRAFIAARGTSDDNGSFSFRHVPAGAYVLQAMVPPP